MNIFQNVSEIRNLIQFFEESCVQTKSTPFIRETLKTLVFRKKVWI
nr:MAG TPA: hypothetical protein [Caudoviricetes sp.]